MSLTGRQDGPKIRALRKARGITIGQMAERVGVIPQHISNIEHDNKRAGRPVLMLIARELGIEDIGELLAEDAGTPRPDTECPDCGTRWTRRHACRPQAQAA